MWCFFILRLGVASVFFFLCVDATDLTGGFSVLECVCVCACVCVGRLAEYDAVTFHLKKGGKVIWGCNYMQNQCVSVVKGWDQVEICIFERLVWSWNRLLETAILTWSNWWSTTGEFLVLGKKIKQTCYLIG